MQKHLRDIPFVKMTGSGNDFVFFDGRQVDGSVLSASECIREICDRHHGVGADGIVILDPTHGADVRISYFNSDGSAADLCGNATLCSTALAVELGMSTAHDLWLITPSGRIAGRVVDGLPEIALPDVPSPTNDCAIQRADGELRVGFASVGIPHLVVLCEDAEKADLASRGPVLRWDPTVGAAGANVNWVSRRADGSWRYRTFERGVEGETLACGTGAVATALLLHTWGLAGSPTTLVTSSGRAVIVSHSATHRGFAPRLRGEGRMVFRGTIDRLGVTDR